MFGTHSSTVIAAPSLKVIKNRNKAGIQYGYRKLTLIVSYSVKAKIQDSISLLYCHLEAMFNPTHLK
jgi:hypothetical protein